MMGEVSLETSPNVNHQVHDMINNHITNENTGSTNLNIFQVIKSQYGESTLADVRHLERTQLKYGNYTNHLRFSLRCLHNNLLPKDLQLPCKVKTTRAREAVRKCSRILLQERIHLNHLKRNRLKLSVEN